MDPNFQWDTKILNFRVNFHHLQETQKNHDTFFLLLKNYCNLYNLVYPAIIPQPKAL